MKKNFEVTRNFVTGPLAGLSFTEKTGVAMPVGLEVKQGRFNASGYVVTSCREVA